MAQALRIFWWQIARTVRRHRLLAICNVLSIALGIAVYLAIRIANDSATRSFRASVDLVAGKAHLEVRGDVDEMLWPRFAAQPGVAAVTGLVETLATLPDKPGEYLRIAGVDVISGEAFRTFELRANETGYDADRWLSTPGGIAISRVFAERHGLNPGSKLPVIVNGQRETLTVLAIVADGELPVDSRFAAMDLGWMQEMLRRPGRLTALQIRLEDPDRASEMATALQPLAPGLTVGPPQQRSAQVGKMLAAFQLNLTALSLVSLLVGVFLVFNTVSTSVARRRVQIGILRALGVTPFGIRALFLGEAVLYAIPGVLLGCLGGVLLATKLTTAVERTVTSLYTLVGVDAMALDPGQFLIAAVYGVLAALFGAWAPAAEASRVSPVDALRRGGSAVRAAGQARWWWVAGLLLGGVAVGSAEWALSGGPRWTAFAAAFFVLASASAFAPLCLRLVSLAGNGIPAALPALNLAVRKLRRGIRRNAITVGALAASVAMFIALAVMVHSFRRSLDAWIGKGIIADLFIAPAANEVFGLNSFLPREAVSWLRARPEVAGADTFRELSTTIHTTAGPETTLLAVVDGAYRNNLSFMEGDEATAMAEVFAGRAVVASEPFAHRFGLGAGSRIELESAQGRRTLPIAGVYADYSRDQGYLLMNSTLFRQLRDDDRVMSVAVYLRPGADAAVLEADFRAAFPGEWSINSSRTLRERILRIFDQTFAVTGVLRTVAIIVAITGVLLTMLTLVLERRRELALVRALGGSASLVGRMITTEAGMLGFTSAVLGLIAGVPLAMVLTWVVNPAFFGWTISFYIPWITLLATPFWITAVAMLAGLWPARIARRVGVAEALHEE